MTNVLKKLEGYNVADDDMISLMWLTVRQYASMRNEIKMNETRSRRGKKKIDNILMDKKIQTWEEGGERRGEGERQQ